MDKISCGILMEDGALVHCSKLPKEWRKLPKEWRKLPKGWRKLCLIG
jgi:hypothetical protein